jgi:hypothetical protein
MTISDLLEQLVASLLALLPDDNNLSRLVNNWEQAVRTYLVASCDIFTCVPKVVGFFQVFPCLEC